MSILLFLIHAYALFASPIHLGIGETYKIKSQPTETIRIQKKGILSIKDEGHQIVIAGKKLGSTQLTLGNKKLQFIVLHKYRKETLEQLKAWLENKRGPQIDVKNNLPELTGQLLRVDDFLDLQRFTHEKSQFKNCMSIDSSIKGRLTRQINKLLVANNLNSGELSTQPQWVYHIGSHEKDNLMYYKKILSPLGIQTQIDHHSLTQKPVIKIQVFIAHIKKSFFREWGIKWPSQAQATLIPNQNLQIKDLALSLQALEDQGIGKTLATPSLITESGHTAEFHSGGEFPIRTTTQFNNNVQWKRYGLFLKATPFANSKKNLKIKIDIELSSLDQTSNESEVPALNRSHVQTQINMEHPTPVLLSGFLQQSQGESRSGLPWLSQIPLFKPLFSSGKIYNNDYELVFILIPRFQDDNS